MKPKKKDIPFSFMEMKPLVVNQLILIFLFNKLR